MQKRELAVPGDKRRRQRARSSTQGEARAHAHGTIPAAWGIEQLIRRRRQKEVERGRGSGPCRCPAQRQPIRRWRKSSRRDGRGVAGETGIRGTDEREVALEGNCEHDSPIGGLQNVSAIVLIEAAHDDMGALVEPQMRPRRRLPEGSTIEFGRTGFVKWCAAANLKPEIDLLFVDTSHLYEHTKQEIAVWSPLLSERGIMIFHDTNMGRGLSGRLGHLIGHGWDNQRGVIRAIEEFLGKHYDENCFFTDVANGFLVAHYPHSNGLTVLKKLSGLV